MADPRALCGRQEVCRCAALFSAVLIAGIAGADTRFVRPTAYPQNLSTSGNVPVVRIVPVSEGVAENSVVQVSFTAPVVQTASGSGAKSAATHATEAGSTTTSGKPLKWVSVNSPEAREIGRGASQSGAEVKTSGSLEGTRSNAPLVTPIPSVMPRCPRVRLTAGEEPAADGLEGLDSLDLGTVEVDDAAAPDAAAPDAAAPTLPEDLGGSQGGLSSPLALPESESLTPEDSTTDMQNPGAIGNVDGSTMNQGGLNQNTAMPESGETTGNGDERLTQLPKVTEPGASEPLAAPGELPLPQDSLTESITTRQVDVEDYDMPCESSEPMHRITDITNDIDLHDSKIVPKSCPLAPVGEAFPAREFAGTNFTWTASNLCHNPLYFEQPALERYGHTIGPLQPVLSGAQFLATIPAMPLLMAIDPPNECQYALGYYRPGSCAPYKWSPIPYSTRGAIVEGGVATALVFLIP